MYKQIQVASLRSCAIARHLELRACSHRKAFTKLKEELSKLRETHFEEVCSLEAKIKKAKEKCSAKEKEQGVKEKSLQDKVALLEVKAWDQEESHPAEVAELREALLLR